MVRSQSTQRPILITGCHRSGSTWLGKMLGFSPATTVIWEPFNIIRFAYALDGLAKHWFTYAPALPQQRARNAFDKVLEGRTGRTYRPLDPRRFVPWMRRGRPIVKDPIACLSSEWLAENFDMEVVVLVRHPAGFASSLKRLNWTFDFDDFSEQKELMDGPLKPYATEIASKPADIIDQAGLLWKCLYGPLFTYADRHPEWIVRTHEELSLEPVEKLHELYDLLDLKWTDQVERSIMEYSDGGGDTFDPNGRSHQLKRNSAANAVAWKSTLRPDEIARIRDKTGEIALRFYGPESW